MRGCRVAGLDCDQPLRFTMSCGWVWVRTCNSNRKCKPCADRNRRRCTRVVGTGMQVQAGRGRRLWLLTLTAPGDGDHRRWTVRQEFVRGAPRPVCSCHVGVDLADWNPAASACWNRLRTGLRDLDPDLDYYRATEVQDRGAIHHHVVIGAARLPSARVLQDLALAAGYGCVIDLRPVEDLDHVDDVAGYVSKTLAGYVTKSSGDGRDGVPWRREFTEDPTTGEVYDEPRRLHTVPTYKTHTQSHRWGCTVAEVKAVAQRQARRRALALALAANDGILPTLDGSDEPIPAGVGPPT